jgi:hypothetical protein
MTNEYNEMEKSKLEIGMTLLKLNKKELNERFYRVDLVNFQLIGNSKDSKIKDGEKKCKSILQTSLFKDFLI